MAVAQETFSVVQPTSTGTSTTNSVVGRTNSTIYTGTSIGGVTMPFIENAPITANTNSGTKITFSGERATGADPYGLVPVSYPGTGYKNIDPITGRFNSDQAYLTRDTATSLENVQNSLNQRFQNDPQFRQECIRAGMTDGYKIAPTEMLRLGSDQAQLVQDFNNHVPGVLKPAAPGTSWHEAGRALDDGSMKKLPPGSYARNVLIEEMQKEGFRNPPGRPDDYFHWEKKGPYSHATEGIAHLKGNGDLQKASENREQFVKDVSANPKGQAYLASRKISGGAGGADPAGTNSGTDFYSKYGNAGNRASTQAEMAASNQAQQQAILDYAIQGDDVSRLQVRNLPTNEGNFSEVQAQLTEASKHPYAYSSKLEHNKIKNTPMLGFEGKVGTPAQIRITLDAVTGTNEERTKNPEMFKNYDTFKNSGAGYIDNFILQEYNSARKEKFFIFDSLGEYNTTFFFGKKPEVMNISGTLLDTKNQEWYNDFQFYYENYLRGTMAIRNRSRIFFIFSDQLIEGLLLDCSLGKTGDTNDTVRFGCSIIVVQRTVVGTSYVDPMKRLGMDKVDQAISSGAKKVNESGNITSAQAAAANAQAQLMNAVNTTMNYIKSSPWVTRMLGRPNVDVNEVVNSNPETSMQNQAVQAQPKAQTPSTLRETVQHVVDNPGSNRAEGANIRNIDSSSVVETQRIDAIMNMNPARV